MNSNSEMTRWTMPTKPEFYALHKSTIHLYEAVSVFVQAIWLVFSISPFATLIEGNVPFAADYALPVAFALLVGLHYALHELVRYAFYNLLDDDPNTVSSFMHYAVIAVIALGMFGLDLQGTTRFLRKENTYKTERTAEESAHRTDLTQLTNRQQSEISRIDHSHHAPQGRRQAVRIALHRKTVAFRSVPQPDAGDVVVAALPGIAGCRWRHHVREYVHGLRHSVRGHEKTARRAGGYPCTKPQV